MNALKMKLMVSNIRLSVAVVGVLLAGAVNAADSASSQFDGVWQVHTPITQLKTADGKAPPLLPEAQKLYAERMAQFKKGDHSFDPISICKPMGEPRTAYDPQGGVFEILVNPKVVLFTHTWNRMVRFVYITDQPVDVIGPAYYGTANARWEGKTLVIDAQGFHEETLLDAAGMPHSDELHITQRYTLKNAGKTLEQRIRFEDPKTFSKAWETVVSYDRKPGARVPEDVCTERLGITGY
ncbi:MAG: hypothetical protein QM808_14230 [Steroidobacteraceae bacterium]